MFSVIQFSVLMIILGVGECHLFFFKRSGEGLVQMYFSERLDFVQVSHVINNVHSLSPCNLLFTYRIHCMSLLLSNYCLLHYAFDIHLVNSSLCIFAFDGKR
jgi:hypothetical protein